MQHEWEVGDDMGALDAGAAAAEDEIGSEGRTVPRMTTDEQFARAAALDGFGKGAQWRDWRHGYIDIYCAYFSDGLIPAEWGIAR